MTIKTGCDLVYIPRFEAKLSEQPGIINRLFTEEEKRDQRPEHLAGLFAAKEAVLKAIGFEPDKWLEIEIQKKETGEPVVQFLGSMGQRVQSIHISISHENAYAMAVAVAQFIES